MSKPPKTPIVDLSPPLSPPFPKGIPKLSKCNRTGAMRCSWCGARRFGDIAILSRDVKCPRCAVRKAARRTFDVAAPVTVFKADCLPVLRAFGTQAFDHVIADPPYSARTHAGVRSHARASLKGGNGKATARVVDLGFEPATRAMIAEWMIEIARVARRWVLIFSDFELAPVWRRCARRAGLRFVQTCVWDRIGGAPQFDGRGPAAAVELVLAFHTKGGARRWNGGGKRGIYPFPIVANRLGQRGSRIHTTQKPDALMLALVRDFTDAGETILDPFAGSGTTGVACQRLGRRFVGIERDAKCAELARERLSADQRGSTLQATRAGQGALFEPQFTRRTKQRREQLDAGKVLTG